MKNVSCTSMAMQLFGKQNKPLIHVNFSLSQIQVLKRDAYELPHEKTMWFLNRSKTNQAVLSQVHLSSEYKGADQLCSYCEADLCLWFCISKLLIFPYGGSIMLSHEINM